MSLVKCTSFFIVLIPFAEVGSGQISARKNHITKRLTDRKEPSFNILFLLNSNMYFFKLS